MDIDNAITTLKAYEAKMKVSIEEFLNNIEKLEEFGDVEQKFYDSRDRLISQLVWLQVSIAELISDNKGAV